MEMRTFTFLVAAAVGASAAAVVSTGAVAQTMGEVTVQATRNVSTKLVGSSSGIPIKEVSLSYGVSTAGLDLATVAGAEELDKRINDAALAACKEVGRQYPKSTPGDAECTEAAAKKAMVTAHELVHAANKASIK
jgi:UrcA family protein